MTGSTNESIDVLTVEDDTRRGIDVIGLIVAGVMAMVYGRLLDEFFVPGTGLSYGQLLVVGLFGLLVGRSILGRDTGEWRVGLILIGIYWILGLSSLLYAQDAGATVDELTDVVQNSLIFFGLILGLTNTKRLRWVVWALTISAALVAAINIYQLATGTFDQDYWGLASADTETVGVGETIRRINGPGLGPNGLAHIMTFCIPLAFDRMMNERKRFLRVLAAVAMITLVVATVFTYSRNGFLTMLLIGVLVALDRGVSVRNILLAAALAVVVLLALAPAQYADRLGTLTKLGSEPATEQSRSVGRASEYIAGVRMYFDHPVLGVGMGNYPSRYLDYSQEIGLDTRREARAPHSLYLQFAAELGAAGLAWLGIAIATALVGLRRGRRAAAHHDDADGADLLSAIEIAFIAFLAFSLFRHVALHRYFLLPLALALAAPGAVCGGFPPPADRSAGRGLRMSLMAAGAAIVVGVSLLMFVRAVVG